MNTTSFDQRSSGIPSVRALPWGSHFCVFYASARELLDAVIPFIRAGLESNEFCSWEVGPPLSVDETARALAEGVPDFARYVALGQIEIVSPAETPDLQARAEAALERRLDQAILAGFDGLRLVRHASRGNRGRRVADSAATIRRLNIIAAVLYLRAEFGALDFMQVVQDHRFALVCNAGRWEVLQGSEARAAGEALERSEEKLRSLFSNMSEGFAYHRIVLNAEGTPCDYVFLEVSPSFERLTGLDAGKIRGKRVTQVLPGIESDPTDWISTYGRVALTGEPVHFESHATALGRWYAVSAFSPHKGYFAVTFADITERKRAEAARRAAEERLLVTLRSIGDGVIATDTEGRVTLMNRVAESLTGWDEAEARGRPLGEVFRIIDDDTGAAAEDPVRKVIEHDCAVGLANHTTLVARDGRRIAIADSAAPVRGDALLGVVLVFRDVSTARLAEHERDLTIEFLRLVNENARTADLIRAAVTFFREQSGCEAVGVRVKDGDDYPYYEASGFSREFLRLENQLCARDAAGKVRRDGAGNPVIEGMCGNVICGRVDPKHPFFTEGGSFWDNDTTGRLATTSTDADRQAPARNRCNEEGYESVALMPLRVGSDRLGLVQLNDRRKGMFAPEHIALWERFASHLAVALARSRAEEALREAEGRLRTANAELIEADQRKNQFLAVLSHELRNPLAPIKSGLYVLDHAAPGGDQARRAQAVITRQADQLARLVDDLLDVTRIARNKVQLQRQRLELNELTRRTIEDHRPLLEQAAVHVDLEPAPKPVFVDADWNRLAQVVGNLLQNAAKFTPRGGRVTVAVSTDAASRSASVRVADTGVGMTSEMMARLFEPFTQADATLDRSKGGLGLGLALVKGLVELHGGEVSATSAGLGQGSEFIVRLPLDVTTTAGSTDAPATAAKVRRRVLVIEDNVDAADMLREVLEFGQHEVAVAYSGPDGIARAREFRPDVVLCDIGLPGMSGYEVARVFRADGILNRAYLVALSGYALPEDLRRAGESGFERHLAKPASLEKVEELLAAIPVVRPAG